MMSLWKAIAVLLLTLIQTTMAVRSHPEDCTFWVENRWYDLGALQVDSYYRAKQNNTSTSNEIHFNFCQLLNINQGSDEKCAGDYYAVEFANNITEPSSQTTCNPLSGNVPREDIGAEVMFHNTSTGYSVVGLTLKYTGGDDQDQQAGSLDINLYCDASVDLEWNKTFYYKDDYKPQIVMKSQYGCPIYKSDQYWIFITNYSLPFGLCIVLYGFFITFWGRILLRLIVAVGGLVVGVMGCFILYFNVWYDTEDLKPYGFWVSFTFGVLIGGALGYFMAMSNRLAKLFIGGYMGFAIGIMLNSLILFLAEMETIFWATLVGLTISFAIVGMLCRERAKCWITALDGSYIIARGVSLLTGHFQNEYAEIDLIKAGAIRDNEYWGYVFFLLFIVLFIMGTWFQFEQFKRDMKKIELEAIEDENNEPSDQTARTRTKDGDVPLLDEDSVDGGNDEEITPVNTNDVESNKAQMANAQPVIINPSLESSRKTSSLATSKKSIEQAYDLAALATEQVQQQQQNQEATVPQVEQNQSISAFQ